jgi:hypothetical protein
MQVCDVSHERRGDCSSNDGHHDQRRSQLRVFSQAMDDKLWPSAAQNNPALATTGRTVDVVSLRFVFIVLSPATPLFL